MKRVEEGFLNFGYIWYWHADSDFLSLPQPSIPWCFLSINSHDIIDSPPAFPTSLSGAMRIIPAVVMLMVMVRSWGVFTMASHQRLLYSTWGTWGKTHFWWLKPPFLLVSFWNPSFELKASQSHIVVHVCRRKDQLVAMQFIGTAVLGDFRWKQQVLQETWPWLYNDSCIIIIIVVIIIIYIYNIYIYILMITDING